MCAEENPNLFLALCDPMGMNGIGRSKSGENRLISAHQFGTSEEGHTIICTTVEGVPSCVITSTTCKEWHDAQITQRTRKNQRRSEREDSRVPIAMRHMEQGEFTRSHGERELPPSSACPDGQEREFQSIELFFRAPCHHTGPHEAGESAETAAIGLPPIGSGAADN